ncbi:mannose-ethanolamine phosphotransferase gpi13 [Ophidiomyces ophidiicola]|nr:mannose-ethanolamine phosphotransferase gpi13 [Ophidiomyces ophidiicola]KAI1964666.1 mannose-ethanolamine phosphotransferase gpi13 [Ophidiomyces ophidiicola]
MKPPNIRGTDSRDAGGSGAEYRKIQTQWANAQLLAEEEARNAARIRTQHLSRRAKQGAASEEELMKEVKQRDIQKNKVKEKEFKVAHGGVLALLGWLVFIHLVGIFFFTKGFLLTRLVLDTKSECSALPFATSDHPSIRSSEKGCWHPKSFDKAVIVIIDALRYDFAVPFHPTIEGQSPRLFHHNIPVLHETALQQPNNAFLLPFIADPPTTTLQRLKGLTTGTLPTFIDAGSNFAGTAIEEDNIIAQLRSAGKRVVHLGDDTWNALFPGYFEEDLSHAYDSFNVWDLFTVDNGVTEHIFPLLHAENATKWDIVIGHYLGVDHAGHRYGPDHAAMAAKLKEMDGVLRRLIETIDDSTLLVVMGDHGMDSKGDHGGESDDEVEATLWMYSKKKIFGRTSSDALYPPKSAKERPVPQIDLVPTLSLLLGLPIPFNNLGSPIEEAFAGANGKDLRNLISVNRLASAQIERYQREYARARGLDQSQTSSPLSLWHQTEQKWGSAEGAKNPSYTVLRSIYNSYREYQRDTLNVCRGLWARFDVPSMMLGIGISAAGIGLLVFYARAIRGDRTDITFPTLKRTSIAAMVGAVAGVVSATTLLLPIPAVEGGVLGAAVGIILGASSTILWIPRRIISPLPTSLWGWLAVVFTVAQSVGFASNSYTIWEDRILLFFLTTFGVLAAISSLRQTAKEDRILGLYHSIIFVVLGRLASLSRLCREEQMPYCRSTYYASNTSSTSAPWQLLIPFAVSLILPTVIRSYYQGTKSYEGSAIFWIGFAFRMGLLLAATYRFLDTADDGNWLVLNSSTLKSTKRILAQIILAIAFAAGTTTFTWAKPCVSIAMTSGQSAAKRSVTILGYANIYGTRYFILVVNFALAVILLQKPMGGGTIAIQIWQILSLLEILDTNHLTTSNSAIGPIMLAVLGSFHFFATGHQATLSSIQWETAFIALDNVRYPWSPLLVIFNTFGAQILSAVAAPLTALWKRPIESRGPQVVNGVAKTPENSTKRLIADIAQASTTHILYYATINLATTMWAGWLRRHLMLYRIFCPRFLMGAAVLATVDIVVLCFAVGGVRWSTISVGDVFGW